MTEKLALLIVGFLIVYVLPTPTTHLCEGGCVWIKNGHMRRDMEKTVNCERCRPRFVDALNSVRGRT